jgi:hypothetical protein
LWRVGTGKNKRGAAVDAERDERCPTVASGNI